MDGPRNGTGDNPSTGLWSGDYLISCFAQEKICVSFGLWLLSFLFWLTSSCLHFYLRCKRSPRHKESVFWHVYGFFGSMCNTIGALLSKQLTIQVITGGYMALADVIHFILTLFPVCSSRQRPISGHRKSRAKRKRKMILSALCVTLYVGVGYYTLNSHGHLYSKVPRIPQRRLLATLLQEGTDVVGFTLGIIAVLVSWTVRVPLITKVCKGLVFPILQIWAVLFSALASLMYAAAIMSHDRRPEYFVRAIPWFLVSLGAAALDVALIFLSCIMKNKLAHQMGFLVEAMDGTDSCELLAEEEEEEEETYDAHKTTDEKNSSWTPLHVASSNRVLRSKAPLGQYMRLSIEQVQKVACGEVRLPGDGQTNAGIVSSMEPLQYLDLSMYPPAFENHDKVPSSSSSESSSANTELEWDFEDLNQHWNKDSDVSCIGPNDSSVMNVSGKHIPSTFLPSSKEENTVTTVRKHNTGTPESQSVQQS